LFWDLNSWIALPMKNSKLNVQQIFTLCHVFADGGRARRSASGLDLYQHIAAVSGGTMFETTKANISAVVDIIKVRLRFFLNYFVNSTQL